MANPKLKLCPFCGCLAHCHHSMPFISSPGASDGWRVECEGTCHAMTCWWHSKIEAIKAWNTRSSVNEREENADQ